MQKTLISVIVILVVLTAGYWWYSGRQEEGIEGDTASSTIPVSEQNIVTVKHAYKDGSHIIVGSLMLPTPCEELSWDTRVAESMPEQVAINFTTKTKEGSEICAQVLTARSFKVTVQASEQARFSATLNGTPLRLNIIEAGEGEDLENFEMNIKG